MSNLHEPISFLGGLTPHQFLSDYWGKKPLLVRRALPEAVHLIVPDELIDLALLEASETCEDDDCHEPHHHHCHDEAIAVTADQENVVKGPTARLITQHGKQHLDWKVKHSPLKPEDFEHLPELWTLLVQAVDHWSPEVEELWQKLSFLPSFRRDDIMVSYAPEGGSVGKHFDYYDVFLVQSYGSRRWQLGQMCNESSTLVPNQPMKLLPEMAVWFDEVLEEGDLLYVPPCLSHFGVAQNDCVTISFGFRMPNTGLLVEELMDGLFTEHGARAKTPFRDTINYLPRLESGTYDPAVVTSEDIQFLKQSFIQELEKDGLFDRVLMTILSDTKFPDALPEQETITGSELSDYLEQGGFLCKEPAVRLIYRDTDEGVEFWSKGTALISSPEIVPCLKRIANGEYLSIEDLRYIDCEELSMFVNAGILLLVDGE